MYMYKDILMIAVDVYKCNFLPTGSKGFLFKIIGSHQFILAAINFDQCAVLFCNFEFLKFDTKLKCKVVKNIQNTHDT